MEVNKCTAILCRNPMLLNQQHGQCNRTDESSCFGEQMFGHTERFAVCIICFGQLLGWDGTTGGRIHVGLVHFWLLPFLLALCIQAKNPVLCQKQVSIRSKRKSFDMYDLGLVSSRDIGDRVHSLQHVDFDPTTPIHE
jgi:hypothetical protein